MKHKMLRVLSIVVLLSGLLVAAAPASAGEPVDVQHMPPNPDKIMAALIERGEIPADATKRQKEIAVRDYLQRKLASGGPDRAYNPLARKKVEAAEEALNAAHGSIRGRKLGKREEVTPSTPQFKPLEITEQLLVILVEFADVPFTWTDDLGEERTEQGPLHNQIPVPDNDFDLWVADFSTLHYQDMLFTPGGWSFAADHPYYPDEHRGSMHDYFLEQSYGSYTVEGDAYGWFTVDKPEAYYGDDHPQWGTDSMLPGTDADMLDDVVGVINAAAAINWADYDLLDLYDLDGDGDIYEPDCIVDHPLFVHAGIDQSGGGGAQGDDALWAHSASYWVNVDPTPRTCTFNLGGVNWTILYNYTVMPEDGGVGVFAHEHAHDLGLPDEYDTIYSGYGSSQGFWTLQASGSWIGRPAQTQPSDMSIWAKYNLGWVAAGDNLAVTHVDSLNRDPMFLRLEQAERWGGEGTYNAMRISLPDKWYYINTPYSGEWEWFGGKADEIDTTLHRTVDLTGMTSAELSFWTWYEIESYWDFGFVQVSTDGGATWTSLPIEGTTDVHDPSAMGSIVANLPGFTGSSGGWVHKTFDLADYLGAPIELQFRYMTDWGTTLAGFYVDDISVVADGEPLFFDDVETEDPAWTVHGWTREQGSGSKPHYYIMEWRNLNPMETPYDDVTIVNFDAGLNNAYTHDPFGPTPNQPYYFPYAPGLLLFYRDMSYTDNWTGAHPGGGFLLVVDAHDQPLIRPPRRGWYAGLEWDTRVQSYDATFSLERAPDITIGRYNFVKTYQGLQAEPRFNDSFSYWNPKAPSASVITPKYGLIFKVVGQAEDGSAALLGFGRK